MRHRRDWFIKCECGHTRITHYSHMCAKPGPCRFSKFNPFGKPLCPCKKFKRASKQ